MDLPVIALCFANGRGVPRSSGRGWCTRRYGTEAGRRPADSRVRLERLHRRHRCNWREHSLATCPRPASDFFALLLVEQCARVVDRLGGDIEEKPVAPLTEHVTPVITRCPQLRVSEGEKHRPHDGERDEVVVGEERNRNQNRVHRQIWRQLATERDYFA